MLQEEGERQNLSSKYKKLVDSISNITINTSSTAIDSLKAEIRNLAQLASSAGINIEIESLESSLSEKEKEVERKSTKIKQKNNSQAAQQAAEEQQRLEEALSEAKVNAFTTEAIRLEEKYNNFNQDFNDLDKLQQQKIELKNKVLKNIKNSGRIDHRELAAALRTPEEIKEEHEKKQSLYKYRDEVIKHYTDVSAYHEQLVEKQKKLQEEINLENAQSVKSQPLDIHKKRELLQHHTNNIHKFSPIVQNAKKQKELVDVTVQKVEDKSAQLKELNDNLKKEVQQYIQSPKDRRFRSFNDLLGNEESAVKEGIVKDVEQRKNFLNTYNFSQNLITDTVQKDAINIGESVNKNTENMIKRLQKASGNTPPAFNKKLLQRSGTKNETHDR